MSRELFLKRRVEFSLKLSRAQLTSEEISNIYASQRNSWCTYLFARLILNASTVQLIIVGATSSPVGYQALDHFSVASVGRTAMEATLMALYIPEISIDEDEWNLRKAIIDLHDATNRHRMFKPIAKQNWERDESHDLRKLAKDSETEYKLSVLEIRERIKRTSGLTETKES